MHVHKGKKLSLLLLFNERAVRYLDLIKPNDPIDLSRIFAANVRSNEEYCLRSSPHMLLPSLVREFFVVIQIQNKSGVLKA